ncbi:MAG: SAM hydroxide adenosyltransferase [bacterium]|nr:hypothetical protein [Gammaproteobacteria bacterium]HIL96644.1 hypothetical protein [Pseudomonadales bacterium]
MRLSGKSILTRFFLLAVFLWGTVITTSIASAEPAGGTILSITEDFGNMDTSISDADLGKLGISLGDSFDLTHKATTVSVHFGFTYSDVPEGEWVSFINETARLRIARNYENAAMTLEASIGDEITISPSSMK